MFGNIINNEIYFSFYLKKIVERDNCVALHTVLPLCKNLNTYRKRHVAGLLQWLLLLKYVEMWRSAMNFDLMSRDCLLDRDLGSNCEISSVSE